MKHSSLAAGVVGLAVLACSAIPAAAAFEPNQPKILLHVTAVTTKFACTTNFTSSLPNCGAAVTSGVSAPDGSRTYFVYVVVAKGDSMASLAGVLLGITYDNGIPANMSDGVGIDVFSWFSCAGTCQICSPFAVPEPNVSAILTWDATTSCQTGPVANAGYFYIAAYSASTLWVIPRPIDGIAKVADCGAMESKPLPLRSLGFASFSPTGLAPGCNPCLGPCALFIPARPATWSAIKTLYDPEN